MGGQLPAEGALNAGNGTIIDARTALDDLVVFALVATHASFLAASQRARIPTSSVSRAVARLEKELGIRLLQRTTRKVTVTEDGRQRGPCVAARSSESWVFADTAGSPVLVRPGIRFAVSDPRATVEVARQGVGFVLAPVDAVAAASAGLLAMKTDFGEPRALDLSSCTPRGGYFRGAYALRSTGSRRLSDRRTMRVRDALASPPRGRPPATSAVTSDSIAGRWCIPCDPLRPGRRPHGRRELGRRPHGRRELGRRERDGWAESAEGL